MPLPIETVAVLGLGTMGQGIAAAVAAGGRQVRVFDRGDRLDGCLEALQKRYGRLRQAAATGTLPALDVTAETTVGAAVSGADLVIEAVLEELPVKYAVLSQLPVDATEVIVATNTSSFPLDAIAPAVPNPERFVATHFFNPAELVPGVEVAAGLHTPPDVLDRVVAFLDDIGKEPIIVGPSAGFVANRLQLALFLEAMACVEDGTATPEDVDTVVRRTFGFRLPAFGPFAVADMAGLDIYANILAVLREAYGDRFTMPEAMRRLVEQGRLGVKTGAGFRDYTPEQVEELLAGRDERYRRLLAAAT